MMAGSPGDRMFELKIWFGSHVVAHVIGSNSGALRKPDPLRDESPRAASATISLARAGEAVGADGRSDRESGRRLSRLHAGRRLDGDCLVLVPGAVDIEGILALSP